MSNPSKGFVIVATNKVAFYSSAMNLVESILDYYEDARITFFTSHPEWIDNRAKEYCENILDCPEHIRGKLYGMANSPYDITFYIDADSVCEHEDIVNVWDELGDNDLSFVRLTKDEVASRSFVEVTGAIEGTDDVIDMILCGGVCLYDMRKPIVRDFMKDWWEMFLIQEEWYEHYKGRAYKPDSKPWWHKGTPLSMLRWDQFTLWWLTTKIDKYKDLKIGEFKDNYRWNWFTSFKFIQNGPNAGKHRLVNDPPVLIHHSSTLYKNKDFRA